MHILEFGFGPESVTYMMFHIQAIRNWLPAILTYTINPISTLYHFPIYFHIPHILPIFPTEVTTRWRGTLRAGYLKVKDSSDPSHFIFEINVGKRRIRHVATYNDSAISRWISRSTKIGWSFKFRVVICRIRLFPTLISKIKWFGSGLPLRVGHEVGTRHVANAKIKSLNSLIIISQVNHLAHSETPIIL